MLCAHPSQPVRYPWVLPISQKSSRSPVRQNSQAPHYRQNKAERPGTRSLTHLCSGGSCPEVGMGDRVLGLCFCVLFCFYIYETDISNPIPTQACRHPPLIVHPLPYKAPQPDPGGQLMLWKRIERPPKYIQTAPIPFLDESTRYRPG